MGDWTVKERAIKTPRGTIYYGGPCKDNYRNIVRYDQGGGHTIFWLQLAAMKGWLEAQVHFANRSGWSKARIKRNTIKIGGKEYVEGRPISILAGTNRTCATQSALYRSDHDRYAPPQYTGHTRALAVDYDRRPYTAAEIVDIRASLQAADWHFARSDEPWHCSYWVEI